MACLGAEFLDGPFEPRLFAGPRGLFRSQALLLKQTPLLVDPLILKPEQTTESFDGRNDLRAVRGVAPRTTFLSERFVGVLALEQLRQFSVTNKTLTATRLKITPISQRCGTPILRFVEIRLLA